MCGLGCDSCFVLRIVLHAAVLELLAGATGARVVATSLLGVGFLLWLDGDSGGLGELLEVELLPWLRSRPVLS